ncbi:MAG: cytochrome c [Bryobacterales bacterium]|nr:cytochrome c [Bryobacterales bacterium]
MHKTITFALILGAAALATGCRQDMHDQPRYRPLAASTFFPDGRSARPAVEGTVARGYLKNNIPLYYGKVARNSPEFVTELPVKLDKALLERGQQRFNIYCSPCHGQTGDGEGMVVQRGLKHPPTYHSDKMHKQPAGYFFDVITNGFGVMPSYAARIPVDDRWAIVAYVKALQLSRAATLEDVPPAERARLEAAGQ